MGWPQDSNVAQIGNYYTAAFPGARLDAQQHPYPSSRRYIFSHEQPFWSPFIVILPQPATNFLSPVTRNTASQEPPPPHSSESVLPQPGAAHNPAMRSNTPWNSARGTASSANWNTNRQGMAYQPASHLDQLHLKLLRDQSWMALDKGTLLGELPG